MPSAVRASGLPPVIAYRRFRNTDPPALVAIWNECFTGRGAYPLKAAGQLERWLFAKLYFNPEGLIVAHDDGKPVAFVHAGFGPNQSRTGLDQTQGVICMLAVLPQYRHQGVGTELLDRAEKWLRRNGARSIFAGPAKPLDPFYFGLYGGSGLPGFLTSDQGSAPFFECSGYRVHATHLVFQRRLEGPIPMNDPRFPAVKRRYDFQTVPRTPPGDWWQECSLGSLEPMEFRLEDRYTRATVAKVSLWDMDGFSHRWNAASAGLLDVQVRPELHRQGLGRYLVLMVMRVLQEQYFGIFEAQAPERNQPAVGLLRGLGFEQVDVGRVFRRERM